LSKKKLGLLILMSFSMKQSAPIILAACTWEENRALRRQLLQPVRKILKVLMTPVTNDVIFYQDSKMAKETLLLLRVIEG
jgi:hypothetical protein